MSDTKQERSMVRFLAIVILVLLAFGVMGSQKVVETGEGKAAEFVLTDDAVVTATDSLPGWKGINSVIIEELGDPAAALIVSLHLAGGWVQIDLSASSITTLPVEFRQLDRIRQVGSAYEDSVINVLSGDCRIICMGG